MAIIGHRIKFKQLCFPVSIGVLPHEQEGPQRLLIDLEIELDNQLPDPQEDLARVLNYDVIRTGIINVAKARHYNLLESLARELLTIFEGNKYITKVRLSIQKPDVYVDCDSVGYEVNYTVDG